MMELGYLGSSSNLSPLARPFTLDHNILIPKTETFVNFTDPPPAVPFSSSLPSWQYSLPSLSNPNFYSDSSADLGVDSIRTSYLTSENYYPYFEAPSISSPAAQMPPLSDNVRTTSDAFAYARYLGEIPTNSIASETYCPSFVAPVVEDDVPLMVLRKTDYDLSSTSRITPLDGSSQVDYHQSLSGLKYKPQCGSYWDRIDRLADDEMGKQVEYDGNFGSRQMEGAGSYVYKSYPTGPSTTEGFSIGKESSAGTHGTCLNLLRGESPFVTPITCELNNKPFLTPGSSFTPYNPARTLGSSTFPQSHAHASPVEAATTLLNHQKPYASQDQSFQPLNAGKIGSVTIKRPSPPVVIRPPSVRSNLRLDRKELFSDSNSSNIKGELSNKPLAEDVEGHLSKAEMELQLPDVTVSDRAKSVSSVEGPLESVDRYYPALDSPCWKGASSFRFSPSEEHGAVTSEHLVKKPESLGALKLQQTQICTLFGEDNAKISGQKAHENSIYPENGYVELGSLLCPDRLPNASSPVKVDNPTLVDNPTHDDGVDHAKISGSNLDPFSNEIEKLTKELDGPSDSKSFVNLRFSQSKQPDSEKYELGREAEAGLNYKDAVPKLDVQKLVEAIHNLSELLLFQCSDNASALSEVGHETLKHAMKNLDACVSKIVSKPAQESNLHKSVISGRPQVTKEASSHLYGNHPPEQGTKMNEPSEKEVKMFTDLFSTRVDEDFEKDNKVTRAIRKVLEENFRVEEEMQSETLLYKNLWLEAEAALCSVSFRARYDRMKTEMDKYKSPKTREPVKTFEELYSEVFQGNPINEAFKMLHKSSQDPSASRTTEVVDEAETSFRAPLNILNNRSPNQSSVCAEEETNEEADAAFAETIKNVEKLLSFDDAEYCAMTNLTPKVPPHAISSLVPSKPGNNVEASVMARFQILKDRGANAISEKSGQQSEQLVSSEHSGQRNPWRFTLSQDCKVSEHELVKDFRVSASGDVAGQLGGNTSLGTQPSSRWWDGSLSDWEDVLKDEVACQK